MPTAQPGPLRQAGQSRALVLTLAIGLAVVGCGGTPSGEQPVVPPTTSAGGGRCAQLAQEVVDAFNRGDRAAEEAASAEYDRLAEAGKCDS
jgi:hypothetical protein